MSKNLEEKLLDDYPSFITIEQNKKIIEQLENGICKIFMNEGGKGTGFFCYIKKENSKISIPVLISNNHVLNEEAIKQGKIIKLSYYENNHLKYMDLKITSDRIVYTSKKYDTTIIEIKKEKDEMNHFLELDPRIFQENSNVIYCGSTIYILHNPGNKSPSVSYGILKKNNNSNYEFSHYCSTESGSSGGPILSLTEMKVFGIHKGSSENFNFNKGLFLKNPIEEFLIEHEKRLNLKNEIIITFNPILKEKNEKFYFLDNTEKEDSSGNIIENKSHIYLKELNELNTKLFIDEKEYKYQKYFIPEKEWIYTIKLIFNIQMKDCSHMFDNCIGIISINFSSFDTSKVTNMSYMFNSCFCLSSINLNNFNTNLVTNMSHMFDNCDLETINLSSFNTSRVIDMSFMFSRNSIRSINLSSFNTINVKNMSYMFAHCKQINSINLSKLNTKNLENKTYMFYGCKYLHKIKVNSQFYNVNDNLDGNNKNNKKKNYYLTNSIIYEFNSSEKFFDNYLYWIQKELNDSMFDVGFQIFSLKDNTLFGVLEGPIDSPYQNGFFFFKIIYTKGYPLLKPPKFIFITQIFHPNIGMDGVVSADFLAEEWTPALRTRTIILSVQSILSEPNSKIFLNQEAAALYELSKEVYDETVQEYVSNYASYKIYKNKVKELNIEDSIKISD